VTSQIFHHTLATLTWPDVSVISKQVQPPPAQTKVLHDVINLVRLCIIVGLQVGLKESAAINRMKYLLMPCTTLHTQWWIQKAE